MIFPSVEWFKALGEEMEVDRDTHERIGEFDVTCVLSVLDAPDGDVNIKLVFEEYSLVEVAVVPDEVELGHEVDFILEGDFEDWQEMLENVADGGRPDREHTLNYLSLPGTPLRCWSTDPLGRDMFFRFNQSLQVFINASHRIHTAFAVTT